jgi:hypothetical protein
MQVLLYYKEFVLLKKMQNICYSVEKEDASRGEKWRQEASDPL